MIMWVGSSQWLLTLLVVRIFSLDGSMYSLIPNHMIYVEYSTLEDYYLICWVLHEELTLREDKIRFNLWETNLFHHWVNFVEVVWCYRYLLVTWLFLYLRDEICDISLIISCGWISTSIGGTFLLSWLRWLLGYTRLIHYVFSCCCWIWSCVNIDLWSHFLLLGDDNSIY